MPGQRSYRPRNIRLRRVGRKNQYQGVQNQGVQRNLLRFAVLLAVVFVLFQMRLAADPVEMYMRVVGDAASPAMTFYGNSPEENQQVFIRTLPEGVGVRVWQKEICLGEVPVAGKAFMVSVGTILLDARGLGDGIRVEITFLGQKYTLDMIEEVMTFDVKR
ncbi:MAG: hypothetical protein FWG40_01645 [Peptococcaceae bacterium]|nr:hypothetical protein [Peptococcaceae bacterium]